MKTRSQYDRVTDAVEAIINAVGSCLRWPLPWLISFSLDEQAPHCSRCEETHSRSYRGNNLGAVRLSLAATSENTAARDLAAAKSLAFGGVGVAGLMSEGERNLRAVLQQSDASQQLQGAFAHASLAGKLYILVGLRHCDRAAYQKVFDLLGVS